jgi:signal transduction histidine kinase
MRLQPRPVDVALVLDDAAVSAQALYPDAKISVGGERDLWADADRDRLTQIVENLIVNAIRYGREPVELQAGHAGPGQLCITVRDHGPGIDPSQEPLLFQRFATGNRRGTGLGLFIVRELARAHGGDAHYESATPGARFVVTLPAVDTVGPANRTEPESRPAAPR